MREIEIVSALLFVDFIFGSKVAHNPNGLQSINIQLNHTNDQYNNGSDRTKEMYSEWTNWSKCRNCKKLRRKICLIPNCGSVLYEEKQCTNTRCRRKNREDKIKIVHIGNKENERSLSIDDSKYTKWSKWQVCSPQCMTKRFRRCRSLHGCPQIMLTQAAFCYKEGTHCQNLVNKILHEKKKHKRKNKKLVRKRCGYVYQTNKYISPGASNNMLKIIGGRVSSKLKWPWHVAIINRHKNVFCGGTLISPRWVLTAGHCIRHIMYVRLNEYDTTWNDGSEIEFRIYEFFRHPHYHKYTIDNDIALLKLPEFVDNSFACLPSDYFPAVGDNCTTMGWGKRKPHFYQGSNLLYEAQLPIVSKDVCLRSYREYKITRNMFCAGYRFGGTDTCAGDSGGGLICPPRSKQGWTIQGITSFGEGCGKRNKYGIYTIVKNYVDWINSIINRY